MRGKIYFLKVSKHLYPFNYFILKMNYSIISLRYTLIDSSSILGIYRSSVHQLPSRTYPQSMYISTYLCMYIRMHIRAHEF